MFWICTVVWVPVAARAAASPSRRGRRGASTATRVGSSDATSAIATGVTLVALLGLLVRERASPAARSTTLRVAGRAPHPGHRQPVVVGRPVPRTHTRRCRSPRPTRSTFRSAGRSSIDLLSNDVIHSFWIPNLQGKIDLVPGRLNTLWLQRRSRRASIAASAPSTAALQHAHMALVVVAEPPDDFERWLTANRAPAPAPVTPEQQRGKDVVEQRTVRDVPHDHRARSAGGRTAPDLTHFASRSTIGAGTAAEHARLPRRLDRRPAAHQARQPHAADRARGDDLQAVLAYLETLSERRDSDPAGRRRRRGSTPERRARAAALEKTWSEPAAG